MTGSGFWLAAGLLLARAGAAADGSATPAVSSVAVEYGTNRYGNALGLTYRRTVSEWLAVGAGVAQAQAALVHKNGETLFWVDKNSTGADLYELAKLDLVGDLFVSLGSTRERAWRWLVPVEVGIGQFTGTLSMRFQVPGYPGIFASDRHYSDFTVYLGWTLVEYQPESTPNLFYGLGTRLHLAHIQLPFIQEAVNQNGDVYTIVAEDALHTGWLLFPYGEVLLRLGYRF